jgi:hypothetical protein
LPPRVASGTAPTNAQKRPYHGRYGRFCALGAGIPIEIRLHLSRDELSGKTGDLPVDQGCIDRDTTLMPEYPVTQSSSRIGIAFPFR